MPKQTYEVRITLKHLKPTIWRKVLVDPETRLDMLHDIIQAAMGWENSHLHAFRSKGKTYMFDPNDEFGKELDEREYSLADLAPNVGDHIEYEYDFGDGWQHEIKVVKVRDFDSKVNVPSVIDGEYACPPEDCGGVWGYTDMLSARDDPKHPQHDEVVDWLGNDFDPHVFNLVEANELLGAIE